MIVDLKVGDLVKMARGFEHGADERVGIVIEIIDSCKGTIEYIDYPSLGKHEYRQCLVLWNKQPSFTNEAWTNSHDKISQASNYTLERVNERI